MTVTLEAVYKDGQLKFKKPLPLAEGTTVQVTITSLEDDQFADIIGICHSGRKDGADKHDKYLKRKRARSFSLTPGRGSAWPTTPINTTRPSSSSTASTSRKVDAMSPQTK